MGRAGWNPPGMGLAASTQKGTKPTCAGRAALRGAQGTVRAGCRSGGSSSRPPHASLEKGAAPHPPAAPLGFAARAVGLQEGESWARPALLPPGQRQSPGPAHQPWELHRENPPPAEPVQEAEGE